MSRVPSFASLGHTWLLSALDTATDGVLIEAAERVLYANDAYAALLGYRRATDLVSRPIGELIAEEDTDRLIRFGRARISGQRVPSAYDFAALRSDVSNVRLQASVSLSMFGGTPYIMTIARRFVGAEPLAAAPIPGPHEVLSARESQVMRMLLDGKRPKEIAFALGLTENTVATHRTRLLGKMGVRDNRELFQYALRHRLVDWS
jgi:PAS domain S-box-containing protein